MTPPHTAGGDIPAVGEGKGRSYWTKGRVKTQRLSGVSPEQDCERVRSSVQVNVELDAQGVSYFPL